MSPTWGHCEECGDFASIEQRDDEWRCPFCRGVYSL